MAKKRKSKPKRNRKFEDCEIPNCLIHKFWPTLLTLVHEDMADAWIDLNSGELIVATGLKVLPDMMVVPMERGPDSATFVECKCGLRSEVRTSLLLDGTIDRCWQCAATAATARSN